VSDLASKLEQQRNTEGPARRTYQSLLHARGFQLNQGQRGTGVIVSIRPMDTRTYWRHVGAGKWNSPNAVYEELKQ
jgi:hypothetical protein